jgi:hypothetical protein
MSERTMQIQLVMQCEETIAPFQRGMIDAFETAETEDVFEVMDALEAIVGREVEMLTFLPVDQLLQDPSRGRAEIFEDTIPALLERTYAFKARLALGTERYAALEQMFRSSVALPALEAWTDPFHLASRSVERTLFYYAACTLAGMNTEAGHLATIASYARKVVPLGRAKSDPSKWVFLLQSPPFIPGGHGVLSW